MIVQQRSRAEEKRRRDGIRYEERKSISQGTCS